MIGGALFISVLCRDKKAFVTTVIVYILATLVIGILLFLSTYFKLEVATATNFNEASKVRSEALSGSVIEENLNRMSFVLGQGAVFSLIFALTAVRKSRILLWTAIGLFLVVAATLPMSRSGIGIMVAQLVMLAFFYRGRISRGIIISVFAAFVMYQFVPDVVFERMHFDVKNKREGRGRVLNAVLEHFDEFALYGIGAGHFWKEDVNASFFHTASTSGCHNSFFQIWVYWGLPGIISWMLMIVVSWRKLPPPGWSKRERVLLWMMGIGACAMMAITHRLSAKEIAIALGLITGVDYWIIEGEKRTRMVRHQIRRMRRVSKKEAAVEIVGETAE